VTLEYYPILLLNACSMISLLFILLSSSVFMETHGSMWYENCSNGHVAIVGQPVSVRSFSLYYVFSSRFPDRTWKMLACMRREVALSFVNCGKHRIKHDKEMLFIASKISFPGLPWPLRGYTFANIIFY